MGASRSRPIVPHDVLKAVERHLGGGSPAPGEAAPILVTADPEFAELIPAFLDNCRLEAASIRKALRSRDYGAIVEASHKLTGAGASYGFQPVSDEGRLIEAAAKAADGDKILVHLDEMCGYLARVSVVYR